MMSRTTKWLLVASSLWYFGEGLFGPLFAVFSEKVGGDLLDITWAWALYLIITGIAYVAIGRIFNRSKWKYHLIVVGYGLNTLFTFAYLLVDDTTSLLLVQAGLGCGSYLHTILGCAFCLRYGRAGQYFFMGDCQWTYAFCFGGSDRCWRSDRLPFLL